MADDEIVLPEVPEAKPEDPEDVSWALSTAEAMWARGNHGESIKWIRKAAEAASEHDQDLRALELAKVAADLTGLVARRSLAAGAAPAPAEDPAPSVPSPSAEPSTKRPPSPVRGSGAPARNTSVPPPSGSVTSKSGAAPRSLKPSAPPLAPRGQAPTPLRTGPPPQDGETRNAQLPPPAAVPPDDDSEDVLIPSSANTGEVLALPPESTNVSNRIPPRASAKPTRASDIAPRSVEEWDASPTQNLKGFELDRLASHEGESDRMTTVGVQVLPRERPPSVHDRELAISQAVRVVVWRDASGVHVAPAGTVVSSITVDAVLVALDPSTDLTAWLSKQGR